MYKAQGGNRVCFMEAMLYAINKFVHLIDWTFIYFPIEKYVTFS